MRVSHERPMWTACLATTVPTLPRPMPPVPHEPPLTLLEWAAVAWPVWPILFVLALTWSVAGRRGATARRRRVAFHVVAAVSALLFTATAAVYASGLEGW